jgi:CheY-like chemotaxis protein
VSKRILVVEDQPDNRQIACVRLHPLVAGFEADIGGPV